MKKILTLIVVILAVTSCNIEEKPNILVLYYSQTHKTEEVANLIQQKLDADIEAIAPTKPYTGTFNETVERGRLEIYGNLIPDIKPLHSEIEKYDIIFLGYPIWYGTFANPIYALNRIETFEGKTIVPFCTFGTEGLESSTKEIRTLFPKAEVKDGFGIRSADIASASESLDEFLSKNGYLEGKCSPDTQKR